MPNAHSAGKATDGETKVKVTLIHDLKERLKKNTEKLKELKQKLKQMQEKISAEKEVSETRRECEFVCENRLDTSGK